jgi:hypothetical protein
MAWSEAGNDVRRNERLALWTSRARPGPVAARIDVSIYSVVVTSHLSSK